MVLSPVVAVVVVGMSVGVAWLIVSGLLVEVWTGSESGREHVRGQDMEIFSVKKSANLDGVSNYGMSVNFLEWHRHTRPAKLHAGPVGEIIAGWLLWVAKVQGVNAECPGIGRSIVALVSYENCQY